jgi:glycosyltransferase involved in cell wall biosynthesis
MTPLKVLHVIPSIGPARGGPSFVIRTLAGGQAEYGMDVHVAATDDDGPGQRTPPASVPFTEAGVTYWIFPRQTRFYLFSFPLTRWLWRHAREYDVIHIHALFSYSAIAAALSAARAGVPYIVRPLGTLNRWGMLNRRRWLKKWSYRLIETRILRGAAAIQYTCEQEAGEARELGVPDTGIVIPNPVDLCGIASVPPGRNPAPTLLFLSRLDPKKGLELLLAAFARVRSQYPAAVLVIAGEGPEVFVDGLKQQSRKLGTESAVVWAGFLQGESKSQALARADVFVLPSHSENFGVAVVEAMGAGVPVVVSDQVGIHCEVAAAGAGLVTQCTVDSLAAALLLMLQEPALRASMAKRAVALAQTFSRESVAQQLAEVYARIRSGHRQPVAA